LPEYTVSQLSKKTGVPATTIRFYLKEGVLKPKRVTPAGYRIFDDFSIEQLFEIRKEVTQKKKSALQEIKELRG
jgi:DNA-binding transcriptional MerR regulator